MGVEEGKDHISETNQLSSSLLINIEPGSSNGGTGDKELDLGERPEIEYSKFA